MLIALRTPAGHAKRWYLKSRTWDARRWQWGLAAAIAVVVFWPQSSLEPTVGLDPSWQAGLAMARDLHIAWGPEVLFTYGPLGFLQTSAYYSYWQSVLATFYQATVIAALFLGIGAALRQRRRATPSFLATLHPVSAVTALFLGIVEALRERSRAIMPFIGAFAITGVTVFLHIGHGISLLSGPSTLVVAYPELLVLAAFTWASIPLLQHEPKRSTVSTTCTVLAAAAGLQLLVKVSTGLATAAIALSLSVLLDWRAIRRHCATMAALAASIPIWWILAGQRLGELPTWLRYEAEIVSGYVEGMAVPPLQPIAWEGEVLTLAWVVALCAMFAFGGPAIPRRFVLLAGVVSAFAAKAAYGRFEPWHFGMLLGTIVVVLAITSLPWPRRTYVVAALVIYSVVIKLSGPAAIDEHAAALARSPMSVADRLFTLVLPGRHAQRVEEAKTRQRALYAIPDRFIATIGSAPVHIDPQEASAAWAYNLNWHPAPVFQTYMDWTPALDKLNAESLGNGPKYVLSRISSASPAIGIDGRLAVQESPLYSRALLCDYKVSGVENRWALFTRTHPHCGSLNPLSQVSIREHDTVNIPAPSGPDMAVLVGIDLERNIKDRLFQGTIVPLTTFKVVVDGVSYRIVARNAQEPFLVIAPDSVTGTNLQIHAHSIGVGRSVNLGQPEVTARLRFYEMRVNP
jgi:hypothetical protein